MTKPHDLNQTLFSKLWADLFVTNDPIVEQSLMRYENALNEICDVDNQYIYGTQIDPKYARPLEAGRKAFLNDYGIDIQWDEKE